MAKQFRNLLILTLVVVGAAQAEVYRWTDAEGNTIYSDTPHEGAEKVELGETSVVPAYRGKRAASGRAPAAAARHAYQSAVIASPAHEATLRNVQDVIVSIAIQPPLQGSDRLQLLVDGAPYGAPGRATQVTVTNVERGEHQLQAVVVGGDGAQLLRSPLSVFFVHKQSVAR